jgi:hypothetical protein
MRFQCREIRISSLSDEYELTGEKCRLRKDVEIAVEKVLKGFNFGRSVFLFFN